jgi:hypothetical protein
MLALNMGTMGRFLDSQRSYFHLFLYVTVVFPLILPTHILGRRLV